MRLLLSSYIFDLFNLQQLTTIFWSTRLLIEPMIGHRIGPGVSDRGPKLAVAASRKVVDGPAALLTALDEQRFCPAHPKACRRLHRDDGVVAAPALNHMPARPSARGHQRDDGSFGLRLRRSSERGDYVSVNEIIALEEQRRSLAEA